MTRSGKDVTFFIRNQPEYQAVKHLENQRVYLLEGARKYGLHVSTLSRFVKKGFIPVVAREGRKMYLNEAFVAYCAAVYNKYSWRRRGRRVFNENGAPNTN